MDKLHNQTTYSYFYFFFSSYGDHRNLHSFPTRRSSDLGRRAAARPAGGLAAPRDRAGTTRSEARRDRAEDRKSTRLNSSHRTISYAVFCLKKKTITIIAKCTITTINYNTKFLLQISITS